MILAAQRSSFFSISRKKQLALGIPMQGESIHPFVDWVETKKNRPSDTNAEIPTRPTLFHNGQTRVCEGVAQHGVACSMPLNSSVDCLSAPRKSSPFLSAFDNPEVLKKFKIDCGRDRKALVLTSNPTNGADLVRRKEAVTTKKSNGKLIPDKHSRATRVAEHLNSPKSRPSSQVIRRPMVYIKDIPVPLQNRKTTALGLDKPVNITSRILTRTMIRNVQKTVTKSIVIPLYQPPMTSTLRQSIISVVTKNVLVPVVQHSTVTISVPHYIMPAQQTKRHVLHRTIPYPRTLPTLYPLHADILETPIPPASKPQMASVASTITVTQYLTSQKPTSSRTTTAERHHEQSPKTTTITKYLEPDSESSKSPETTRPSRTVTVFRNHGDQTITLDLREKKARNQVADTRCDTFPTMPPETAMGASNLLSSGLIENGEDQKTSKSIPFPSKDGTTSAAIQSLLHSASTVRRDLQSTTAFNLNSIYGKPPESSTTKSSPEEDELVKIFRRSGLADPRDSKSTVVFLRPRDEKLTVTVTNISTVTITKNRESQSPTPGTACKTITVSDSRQLNDKLQELENSFKSGTESYLNLIIRIIKMLEDERRGDRQVGSSIHLQPTPSDSQQTKRYWQSGMEKRTASGEHKDDYNSGAAIALSSILRMNKNGRTSAKTPHNDVDDSADQYTKIPGIWIHKTNSMEPLSKLPPKTACSDLDVPDGNKAGQKHDVRVGVEPKERHTIYPDSGGSSTNAVSSDILHVSTLRSRTLARSSVIGLPSDPNVRTQSGVSKVPASMTPLKMHADSSGHGEFRNPLLEILDLVSGNGGKSSLVESYAETRRKRDAITQSMYSSHYTVKASIMAPGTTSKVRNSSIQTELASAVELPSRRLSSPSSVLGPPLEEGSWEYNKMNLSLKNELLRELMKFINKDSRSEEDILKILGLIRLVKDEGDPSFPAGSREIERELGLVDKVRDPYKSTDARALIAKTVTIISNEGDAGRVAFRNKSAYVEKSAPKNSAILDGKDAAKSSPVSGTSTLQRNSSTVEGHLHDEKAQSVTEAAKQHIPVQKTTTVYFTTTHSKLSTETSIKDHTKTLTVDHTVTERAEAPSPKTVTVSHAVSHLKTVTVRQTVTQHLTVTYHPPVVQHAVMTPNVSKIARALSTTTAVQIKNCVSPRSSAASVSEHQTHALSDLSKNLYILSPVGTYSDLKWQTDKSAAWAQSIMVLKDGGHMATNSKTASVEATHGGVIELGDKDKIIGYDGASRIIELGDGRSSTQVSSPRKQNAQKRKRRIRSAEITLEDLSGDIPKIIDINLPIDQLKDLLEKTGQD